MEKSKKKTKGERWKKLLWKKWEEKQSESLRICYYFSEGSELRLLAEGVGGREKEEKERQGKRISQRVLRNHFLSLSFSLSFLKSFFQPHFYSVSRLIAATLLRYQEAPSLHVFCYFKTPPFWKLRGKKKLGKKKKGGSVWRGDLKVLTCCHSYMNPQKPPLILEMQFSSSILPRSRFSRG